MHGYQAVPEGEDAGTQLASAPLLEERQGSSGEARTLVFDLESPLEEVEQSALAGATSTGSASALSASGSSGRAKWIVIGSNLGVTVGFYLALTTDATAPWRQVRMPAPKEVIAKIRGGRFKKLLKGWHKMPPLPTDLDKLSDSMKEQRSSYWLPFLAAELTATVLVGTAIVKIPLPRRFRRLFRPEFFTSTDWEYLTWVFMGPYLILVIKVTSDAGRDRLLSSACGLAWEQYHEILQIGEVMLLGQAIALRILRPDAEFAATGFAGAVANSLLPFVSDPFDTLKDCIFASMAMSSPNYICKTIGVVSYVLVVGLHCHVMTDDHLKLEMRAPYCSVLLLPPKAEAAETDVVEESVCPSPSSVCSLFDRHCGEELLSLLSKAPTKLREFVKALLPKLFMQCRKVRQDALILEDVPQGILAVIYSVVSWLALDQGTQPVVLLLNIIVPGARLLGAKVFHNVLARACVEWLEVQCLQAWSAGQIDLALEFRSELAYVRRMDDSELLHVQALVTLKESSHELALRPAAETLRDCLFQSLKDGDALGARDRLEDLLTIFVLDPGAVPDAFEGAATPEVGSTLTVQVFPPLILRAFKLLQEQCKLEGQVSPDALFTQVEGFANLLCQVRGLHKTAHSPETFSAERASALALPRVFQESFRTLRKVDARDPDLQICLSSLEDCLVLARLDHPSFATAVWQLLKERRSKTDPRWAKSCADIFTFLVSAQPKAGPAVRECLEESLGDSGCTLLHISAALGVTEVLSLGWECHADLNKCDNDLGELMPVEYAIREGQLEALSCFLPWSSTCEPLFWACFRGNIKAVRHLCDLKADVNQFRICKSTLAYPIHAAIYSGCEEVFRELRIRGVNLRVKNKDGRRLLEMLDLLDVRPFPTSFSTYVRTPRWEVAVCLQEELDEYLTGTRAQGLRLKELLDKSTQCQLFYEWASAGNAKAINWLWLLGVDCDARNEAGEHAGTIAASRRNRKALATLPGYVLVTRNKAGKTAVDLLYEAKWRDVSWCAYSESLAKLALRRKAICKRWKVLIWFILVIKWWLSPGRFQARPDTKEEAGLGL